MSIISALLAALLQVTLGLLFAAVLCDWRGQVTRGFLFITAGTALVVALLAFGLGGLSRIEGLERLTELVLLAGLAVYSVLCGTVARGPRLVAGGLGLAGGLITLALAAQGRPSPFIGPDLTVLTYLLSALALGTALGGLLLGHWYLNTPSLTSRPLKLLCDLLLGSLLPLTALAGWYLLHGAEGVEGVAAGGLSGVALWMAAGMVTLFPFGVTVAARICCVDGPGRGRSLQAATGLLYLVAAAVLAGGLAGNAVLLGGSIRPGAPFATASDHPVGAEAPARRPGRRARTVVLRLALLLLSSLLPLLVLELALRWFGPILPGNYSTGYYLTTDPVYGRFHVRDFSGWTRTPEYTTFMRTDALGLRGGPVSSTPAAGTYRILVTGDSFVEAAQVREDESFTERLNRSLDADASGRYEVLNAGIGGWGTGQEMLYLRNEGLALHPSLVLLVLYVGNDIVNNSPTLERQDTLETPYKPYWDLDGADGLRQLPHQERPAEPDDWALRLGRRDSALFNFVETGFFDKFKYRDLDVVGNQGDVGKPVLLARYPPEWEQSWQITERLLAQAAADAAQAGVSFVVVAAPSTFQVVPEDWRQLVRESHRPQSDWNQDKPSQRLAEIAARRGLTLIDLLPALRAARESGSAPLYYDRDKHWTSAGHQVVAETIESRLRELGLIPNR